MAVRNTLWATQINTLRYLLPLTMFFVAGCAQLEEVQEKIWQNPKVNLVNTRIAEVNEQEILLVSTIRLNNPNPLTLVMGSISYDLYLDDDHVLYDIDLSSDSHPVPARGHKLVELPYLLTGNVFDVFRDSLNQNGTIAYNVSGSVAFLGFPLSFDGTGDIVQPKVTVGDFTVNKITRTNVHLEFEISVLKKSRTAIPGYTISYFVLGNGKNLFSNTVRQPNAQKLTVKKIVVPVAINPINLYPTSLQLQENTTIDLDIRIVVDFGYTSVPASAFTTIQLRDLL